MWAGGIENSTFRRRLGVVRWKRGVFPMLCEHFLNTEYMTGVFEKDVFKEISQGTRTTIAAYFMERWDILTHLSWISVLTTQRSQLRSENVYFVVWFIFISTFGPFYTDVNARYTLRV